MLLQAVLVWAGVYENVDTVPPRLVLFAVLPAVVSVISLLIFFRSGYIRHLGLDSLTLVQTIRIPVEIVLYFLYIAGQVPQMMTFEGRNFDIIAGIAAPVVYWLAVKDGLHRRGLLIAYNLIGLVLLANIVSIAALSLQSPIQQLNFDRPNRAVLDFPFIWLPAVVVPIALFAHLASLAILLRRDRA